MFRINWAEIFSKCYKLTLNTKYRETGAMADVLELFLRRRKMVAVFFMYFPPLLTFYLSIFQWDERYKVFCTVSMLLIFNVINVNGALNNSFKMCAITASTEGLIYINMYYFSL